MKNKEVINIIKKGKYISTPYINIYLSKEVLDSKIACVAGKKISSSSVKRHRVQRRLRELSRSFKEDNQINNRMVWVAKPAIKNVTSFKMLKESINSASDRIIQIIK